MKINRPPVKKKQLAKKPSSPEARANIVASFQSTHPFVRRFISRHRQSKRISSSSFFCPPSLSLSLTCRKKGLGAKFFGFCQPDCIIFASAARRSAGTPPRADIYYRRRAVNSAAFFYCSPLRSLDIRPSKYNSAAECAYIAGSKNQKCRRAHSASSIHAAQWIIIREFANTRVGGSLKQPRKQSRPLCV